MSHKAFTLLEMLVSLALLGIVFGLMVLYSQVSVVRTDLNAQVDTFVSYARLAQSYAASGKDGGIHGVYLEEDSYTVFVGSSYNAASTTNTVIDLPPSIEIQNISLNGGGTTILFSAPEGETSNYGTLDFVSSAIGKTVTVTLDARGTLNY